MNNKKVIMSKIKSSPMYASPPSDYMFLAFSFASARRLMYDMQPAAFSCSTSSDEPTIPRRSYIRIRNE